MNKINEIYDEEVGNDIKEQKTNVYNSINQTKINKKAIVSYFFEAILFKLQKFLERVDEYIVQPDNLNIEQTDNIKEKLQKAKEILKKVDITKQNFGEELEEDAILELKYKNSINNLEIVNKIKRIKEADRCEKKKLLEEQKNLQPQYKVYLEDLLLEKEHKKKLLE